MAPTKKDKLFFLDELPAKVHYVEFEDVIAVKIGEETFPVIQPTAEDVHPVVWRRLH